MMSMMMATLSLNAKFVDPLIGSGGLGFGAGTTGQIMGVCGALVIATQICVYLL